MTDGRLNPTLAALARPEQVRPWTDDLNPIFTREVVRLFSAKGFLALLYAAPIGATAAILVAWHGARHEPAGAGAAAFETLTRFVIAPVAIFETGIRAFFGVRSDAVDSHLDALALSQVAPDAIVRGHVRAAGLRCALWLAVLAPSVAAAYLLRGLSLAEIAGRSASLLGAAWIGAAILARVACFGGGGGVSRLYEVLAFLFAVLWTLVGVDVVFNVVKSAPLFVLMGGCCGVSGAGFLLLVGALLWNPFSRGAQASLARPSIERILERMRLRGPVIPR